MKLADRFWSNVTGTVSPFSCWRWTGTQNGDGYGYFLLSSLPGKQVLAHRFSYELEKGAIGRGLQVMHSCDNRLCVNPAHLSLGTNSDNIADAVKKGRKVNKLTREQADEIRARYADGETQASIAADFSVSQMTVSLIVRNKFHVG